MKVSIKYIRVIEFVKKIYTSKHVTGVYRDVINDIPVHKRFVIVKQRTLIKMCA